MEKTWNNIGYAEINEILGSLSELSTNPFLKINLVKENEFYGEIDQLFSSYLILLFKKNQNLRVEIIFTEPLEEGRIRSFSIQIGQLKFLYSSFVTNENFKLIRAVVDKSTGDINLVDTYNKLGQAESFIPPIYIDKLNEDKSNLFENKLKETIDLSNLLIKKYYEKLITEIEGLIENKQKKNTKNQDSYLREIPKRIKTFSFLHLYILRILIHKVELKDSIFKRKGNEKNIQIIENLISFSENLITGLKELAINIQQHSGKDGVLTIRKFDRERLIELKGQDENKFLILDKNENVASFLDINVIDLGEKDIKSNYINNLKVTRQSFIEISKKELPDLKDSELLDNLKESINISFNDDINIIKSKDFSFHKLFIKDYKNGINGLSVQKNKFISKIGLQYFTTIIKDVYEGFVKVSSYNKENKYNEKTLIYNNANGNFIESKNLTSFINKGTFYNCLVPIKNWKNASNQNKAIQQHSFSQNTNTFNELSKYNYIERGNSIVENYNTNSNINNVIDYTVELENDDDVKTKYDDFFKLFLDLKSIQKGEVQFSSKTDIIAISCEKLQRNNITDASHWIRFIWTLTNYFENIILYDINLHYFKEIRLLRTNFSKHGNDFWEDKSRILFYSKETHSKDNEYYRYGANILAGKSIEEFNYLNKTIWKHHYSFKGEHIFDLNEKSEFDDSIHLKSALFSKIGKNLHYYEVLLKTSTPYEKNISLFEKSVQYSLNTLLVKRQSSNTNNKGYKVDNTHFRLGSKIHISDFYYAKKLFQNSFFTTPLAYQISENIWESYFKNGKALNKDVNSFTIVGYENYSSFLISSVRNFIYKRIETLFPKTKINHVTIDKDGKLSRERHKLQENILIIVPIATSFNTSLKIEDQLNGIASRAFNDEILNFEKIKIIPPIQNIVLVAHRSKKDNIFINGKDFINFNEIETIYNNYNWKSIDKLKKIVTIERYNYSDEDSENRDREQKYLIPVYTKWEEAQICNLCFPVTSPYDEKCLIETGQASITPQVIFGFPKTKPFFSIINKDPTHLYLEGSLLYGNLKNKNNKYLYFNRTGKLIEDNNNEIKEWIKDLQYIFRDGKKFKQDFVNQKVVIITPNTGSRSKFLDMINEFLFEYTANCIIISLNEDYIENSETLYSDGLHNADTIVYVDDVLSTANSFLECNNIIKYIRNKSQTGEGIDYCISLINRMSFSDEENLLLKLIPLKKSISNTNSNKPHNKEQTNKTDERLIYYYKINNPTIEEASKKFPLDIEREKYDFLERNSSLDEIRKYFYLKRNNIKEYNLKESPPSHIKDYSLDFSRKKKKRNKKLFQSLVLNALYSIFEYNFQSSSEDKEQRTKEKKIDDKKWVRKINDYFPTIDNEFSVLKNDKLITNSITRLIKKIQIILINDFEHRHIIDENKNNLEFVILKVICSTPLIYYKQIRETSFYWVLIELKNTIENISKLENIIDIYSLKEETNYSLYQNLKFLLKKSVKLRSNFIIHNEILEFFRCEIEKLNAISNEQKEVIKSKINPNFKEQLQGICLKNEYLSVPSLKLKLYDFIQNCLKDGVFESIKFDSFIINRKGILDNDKKQTNRYHKELIENYRKYRFIIDEENMIKEFKPLVKKEDKKISKNFEDEFNRLLKIKRYKLSSAKKFITHIVALVQELVYLHETKSIKLDSVLKEFQNDSNKYNPNSDQNGNFNHLLRLLHLENIEIINEYSTELINKLIIQADEENKLKIPYLEKDEVNRQLKKDKKYIELCKIQNENEDDCTSIDSFISLKRYLQDLKDSIGKDDKIQEKIEVISHKLKNIIGTNLVENIFITINYKDFKEYKSDDLYTFALNDKSINRIEIINDKNSLTSFMGNEKFKEDENLFSHFEIIKNNNELKCRDLKEIKKIIKSETSIQYNDLGNNKSILLIRLSDFNIDNNSKEQPFFNTLGVITIYLKHNKRLNEKKLRLILALRHDLTEFIKNKTSGTTFLELLQSKEKDEFQGLLRHSVRTYLTNQSYIYKILLNKQKERIKLLESKKPIIPEESLESMELIEMLQILNNAIGGQTDNFKITHEVEKYYKDELYAYIEKLLETDYLGNGINSGNYKIQINQEHINLHKTVYDVIIPELIYNLKKYTPSKQKEKGVSVYVFNNKIIFKNNINKFRSKNKKNGEGRRMCAKILAIYKDTVKYSLINNEILGDNYTQNESILKIEQNGTIKNSNNRR